MNANPATRDGDTSRHVAGPVSEFLQSLRRRMQHVAPTTPLPSEPASLMREVAPEDDLVARFMASAEAAGCRVWRAEGPDWLAVPRRILSEHGAKHVVVEPQPGTALTAERASELCRALAADGIGTTGERDDETLFTADAAITGVCGAIAETGTLVCASGPSSARGASLIPPVHIALVAAGQVLPDLFDAFEKGSGPFSRAGLPSPKKVPDTFSACINLITGPSKTADIEGVLVTGVHGPGTVHVVLV